jgi:uncharacterized short protein YbdD (DUF466 family)
MATSTVQRVEGACANKGVRTPNRWRHVRKIARRLWRGVRDWCGDSAYERYLHSKQQLNAGSNEILSEEKFYVEQLQRKFSRPNRCC